MRQLQVIGALQSAYHFIPIARARNPLLLLQVASKPKFGLRLFTSFSLSTSARQNSLFQQQNIARQCSSRTSQDPDRKLSFVTGKDRVLNPVAKESSFGAFARSAMAHSAAAPPSGRYGVLVTGHAPQHTLERFGDYDKLLIDLLRDPGEVWESFAVVDGVFPDDEAVASLDGIVLTGSRHDAHADEDWILRLCALLQAAHARRQKILGICFGHQVLCRALGGQTGRAPTAIGWDCGLRRCTFTDAFARQPYSTGVPRELLVLEFHRDQVSQLPPGGELLASSPRTPIEMFSVGERVLGIQGHPEFNNDIVRQLADVCVERGTLTEEVAEEIKDSVKEFGPNREELQSFMKAFLKSHDKK